MEYVSPLYASTLIAAPTAVRIAFMCVQHTFTYLVILLIYNSNVLQQICQIHEHLETKKEQHLEYNIS